MKTKADGLADYLEHYARSALDHEAAHLLRYFAKIHGSAYDVVMARNETASRAAYKDLSDLIRHKRSG